MEFVLTNIPSIFPLCLAYFIGSIPFGLILTKLSGKGDIRTIGSGNIGATNVLRSGSKFLAAATLLLDLFKGYLASFLIYTLALPLASAGDVIAFDNIKALQLGLIAIIGHCFPIWLKFKGGKGVATTLGVLLAAVPVAGVAACGVWLAAAFLFKISSLAALIAIGSAPVVAFFIYGAWPAGICALIALLVFWRHKENIQRLLKGAEPKIGAK